MCKESRKFQKEKCDQWWSGAARDDDDDDDNGDDDDDNDDDVQELRESRSAAGSPSSLMKIMEDYKATEFISIFQKFKLAFNLLV